MPRFFKVGLDHFFGVSGSVPSGCAHQLCGPKTQQFIAACVCFELHFRIVREFFLERVLAILKGTHIAHSPQVFCV